MGELTDAIAAAAEAIHSRADAMLAAVARGHGIGAHNAHKWIKSSTYEGDSLVQWFQRLDDPRMTPHGVCVVVSPDGVRVEDRGERAKGGTP